MNDNLRLWANYKEIIVNSENFRVENKEYIYLHEFSESVGLLNSLAKKTLKTNNIELNEISSYLEKVIKSIAKLEIVFKLPSCRYLLYLDNNDDEEDLKENINVFDIYKDLNIISGEIFDSFQNLNIDEIQYNLNVAFNNLMELSKHYNISLKTIIQQSLNKTSSIFHEAGIKSERGQITYELCKEEFKIRENTIKFIKKEQFIIELNLKADRKNPNRLNYKGLTFIKKENSKKEKILFFNGDIILDYFKISQHIVHNNYKNYAINHGPQLSLFLYESPEFKICYLNKDKILEVNLDRNKSVFVTDLYSVLMTKDIKEFTELLDYIQKAKHGTKKLASSTPSI